MATRIENVSRAVPGVGQPLRDLVRAVNDTGLPLSTLVLVHLRVSQLNGRSVAVPTEDDEFRQSGEKDRRLPLVATWRDQTVFTEAEGAALALAEAVTNINAGSDPVPDDVWAAATAHYNEVQLGALLVQIGLVNFWNRVNIATRQQPVDWRVNPKEWVAVV